MKFMVMHKSSAATEAEQIPSQELIAKVGNLLQSAMQDGSFIDAAGLLSSARRVRVTFAGGEKKVQRGPYRGERELISSCAMLRVKAMPEAIEWASRLAEATGTSELEVGPLTEPWDLGVVPRPEGEVPLQVLVLLKANAESERGSARDEQTTATQRVLDDAKAAGVLVSHHVLLPSARGARISGAIGARTVVDGTFSESKELVAGFMLMKFASKEAATEFALKYADIVETPEVDIREAG